MYLKVSQKETDLQNERGSNEACQVIMTYHKHYGIWLDKAQFARTYVL